MSALLQASSPDVIPAHTWEMWQVVKTETAEAQRHWAGVLRPKRKHTKT